MSSPCRREKPPQSKPPLRPRGLPPRFRRFLRQPLSNTPHPERLLPPNGILLPPIMLRQQIPPQPPLPSISVRLHSSTLHASSRHLPRNLHDPIAGHILLGLPATSTGNPALAATNEEFRLAGLSQVAVAAGHTTAAPGVIAAKLMAGGAVVCRGLRSGLWHGGCGDSGSMDSGHVPQAGCFVGQDPSPTLAGFL